MSDHQSNLRKIKVEHFKNLVAVACSDGYYDDVEKDYLAEKAVEYGLTTEIVSGILIDSDNLKFQVPENLVDSEEQLADIIYLAIIDGVIRPKEYEICLNIAEKLGFDKSHVDKVIEETKKYWNIQQSE